MSFFLYEGDCLEYMRGLPDNHFDFCITDPPYGIKASNSVGGDGVAKSRRVSGFYQGKNWDNTIPGTAITEAIRVSSRCVFFWR